MVLKLKDGGKFEFEASKRGCSWVQKLLYWVLLSLLHVNTKSQDQILCTKLLLLYRNTVNIDTLALNTNQRTS